MDEIETAVIVIWVLFTQVVSSRYDSTYDIVADISPIEPQFSVRKYPTLL